MGKRDGEHIAVYKKTEDVGRVGDGRVGFGLVVVRCACVGASVRMAAVAGV